MSTKSNRWVKVRSSLFTDPKHEVIGAALRYYLWLLDQADWETGIIWSYTDSRAADSLQKPKSTVIKHRQHLVEHGYIKCYIDATNGVQHILIYHWQNPREVCPDMLNLPGRVPETLDDLLKAIGGVPKFGLGVQPNLGTPQAGLPLYTHNTHTNRAEKRDSGRRAAALKALRPTPEPDLPAQSTEFEKAFYKIVEAVFGYKPRLTNNQRKDLLNNGVRVTLTQKGGVTTTVMPPPAGLYEENPDDFLRWIEFALKEKKERQKGKVSNGQIIATVRGYDWRKIGWIEWSEALQAQTKASAPENIPPIKLTPLIEEENE